MTTKQAKVDEINQALNRSSIAVKCKAEAFITEDGRIEYRMLNRVSQYTMKISFSDMLSLLHGADMRALKAKYGR